MSQHSLAVLVENLGKTYGVRPAVDGVSFAVCRGEVFAILGPNGAGKTTTVEILEGLRQADQGRVSVLGFDPTMEGSQLKPRIGAMLQEGGLYPAISPREALRLFGHYYANPVPAAELLARVGLEESARTPYRSLSGGQKQRLSLALALVGRPELVFLDEPTAGMDPQARRVTWEIIAGLRREEVTVLLTTHYLEEAERLADRVAILDRGRLVALGSPAALTEGSAPVVRVRTRTDVDPQAIAQLPSAATVREAGRCTYLVETANVPSLLIELTNWARDAGVPLLELRVGQGSLEDVFFRVTGRGFES